LFGIKSRPADPEKIVYDLGSVVRGELRTDPVTRSLYSTDASLFQVVPVGVFYPRDEEDVVRVVRYAAENELVLLGRGAGSGLAGESLGTGLVIDFSRHLHRIVEIGEDYVRVQPGVVLSRLDRELARRGRWFAPDPASAAQCTLGGMLATNASGCRALKYGYTRDHVLGVRSVFADGTVAECGLEPIPGGDEPSRGKEALVRGLVRILEQYRAEIGAESRRTPFNRCGYLLHDVLSEQGLALARFLTGSEGTLALFTEATLRTLPRPLETALLLCGFGSADAATEAVLDILRWDPSACELMDRRLVSLTQRAQSHRVAVHSDVEAVLLVEIQGYQPGQARTAAAELYAHLHKQSSVLQVQLTYDEMEQKQLWQLRDQALPVLFRLQGAETPVPYIEDLGVPVAKLGEALRCLQDLLQRHETTATFLVHAGAGQIHMRPFVDLAHADSRRRLFALAEEVYAMVLDWGGTISTQHGVGLARTPWVERQYGRLYRAFRDIKDLFDPKRLLNPGKIVAEGSPQPEQMLRQIWRQQELRPLSLPLYSVAAEACGKCNGCADCRIVEPDRRMCPLFRLGPLEEATPRSKANLLRSLLDGTLEAAALESDEARTVLELCFQCRLCAQECPARVPIPQMVLGLKAALVAENGLPWRKRLLAMLDGVVATAARMPRSVNALLRTPWTRWLLELATGLSRSRPIPRLAQVPFCRRHPELQLPDTGRDSADVSGPQPQVDKVVYFVDTWANYACTDVAEATLALLQHAGLRVAVPPEQRGCGFSALMEGDVGRARELAEHNVHVLKEYVHKGYWIVCSEPAAAMTLVHDYPHLVPDDGALVAERTLELTALLAALHRAGRLPTPSRPLELLLAYHIPCHLLSLGQGVHSAQLLALIPHLKVRTIATGCSGMGWHYGLAARHVRASLHMGAVLGQHLQADDVSLAASECTMCRVQMDHLARKPTVHPVQVLAWAYGLQRPVIE